MPPDLLLQYGTFTVPFLLLALQRYVISRTDSTAIKADALHYRTDLLVNGSVILALWLSVRGWPGFDALDHLMDKELPDDERDRIKAIALAHEQVLGLHDLRSRRSGLSTFIQLHLELDDDLSLLQAHRISDEVEESLMAAYPESEVIIHFDPISVVPSEPVPEFLQPPAQ